MFNHAPVSYACPFCLVAAACEGSGACTIQSDIILRTQFIIAFIASHGLPNNRGHVLVVPVKHYENLYDLPDSVGAQIFSASRLIAIAMKNAYGCDGVSTRQHNEPAGYQEVWHYHLHVFPRYPNDRLYTGEQQGALIPAAERSQYAVRLRRRLRELSGGVPAEAV